VSVLTLNDEKRSKTIENHLKPSKNDRKCPENSQKMIEISPKLIALATGFCDSILAVHSTPRVAYDLFLPGFAAFSSMLNLPFAIRHSSFSGATTWHNPETAPFFRSICSRRLTK